MSSSACQDVDLVFDNRVVNFGRVFGCAFKSCTIERRCGPCDNCAEGNSDAESSVPSVVSCGGSSERNAPALLR